MKPMQLPQEHHHGYTEEQAAVITVSSTFLDHKNELCCRNLCDLSQMIQSFLNEDFKPEVANKMFLFN